MVAMSRIPDEIIDAFRVVAPTLEAFARENDLFIDRYRRGKAAWELRFARQQGGESALVVSYRERTGHVLDVSAIWWLDDFASRTRRLRSEKIGVYYRREPAGNLGRQLTEGLRRIDAWTAADLGQPFGPYRDWEKTHTAETFQTERDRLPLR